MLYVKFGKNRLRGIRGDVVWKCWRTLTTDGRRMPAYAISSPISLRYKFTFGKSSPTMSLRLRRTNYTARETRSRLPLCVRCLWVYLICFQCKIEFYLTEWPPKAVFSRWQSHEWKYHFKACVHEWNEIWSYTGKNLLFFFLLLLFMLLFTIIMLSPTRQLSRQNYFPGHFASVLSCSAF